MMKRFFALLLSAAMLLSLCLTPAFAAEDQADAAPAQELTEDVNADAVIFPDAQNNWAKEAILRWNRYGIVNGDENGMVNPDRPMRRCELAQVLVNLLGLTRKGESTFSDLTGAEWYADTMLKCAAAGIVKGDGTRCRPEDSVTREEAIVMFGRAMGVRPSQEPDLSKFQDGETVSDWAAPYLAPLTEMGILSGVGDGTNVAPTDQIDRASTFELLNKAIAVYIDAPGDYEADNANGYVVVNVADNEGNVTLTGETAGLVVSDGTSADVVAKDLTAATVKVDGAASLAVEGESAALGQVQLNNADATLTVGEGVTVETVEANAAATIVNNGTIKQADINESGVTLDGNAPQAIVKGSEEVADPVDSQGETVEAKPEGTEKPSDKDKPADKPSSSTIGAGPGSNRPSTPVVTKKVLTVNQGTDGTVAVKVNNKAVTLTDNAYSVEKDAAVVVTVTAKEGKEFKEWSAEGIELADKTATELSFKMPGVAVTLTASYKDKEPVTPPAPVTYALTVNQGADGTVGVTVNGDAVTLTDSVYNVAKDAAVVVTVAANEGKEFKEWSAEGIELADKTANPLSFAMPEGAVTLTASYKDKVVTPPTPVVKTALESAIAAANNAKTDVVALDKAAGEVDKGVKFVTAAEMKALTDAMETARALLADDEATQEAVDAAAAALNGAVDTFKSAVETGTKEEPVPVVVDKTALTAAITAAGNAKTSVTVSNVTDAALIEKDTKVANQAALDALNAAIDAAQAVADKADATQAAVDAAKTALDSAVTAFDAAVVTGTATLVATAAELTAALAQGGDILVSENFESNDYVIYEMTKPANIRGQANATVKGSFVVKAAASGSLFESLTIANKGCAAASGEGAAHRNAIAAHVAALTVKNCVLDGTQTGESDHPLANGLMICPSDANVNFVITGNTIRGFKNVTTTGDINWASSGIMITGGMERDYLNPEEVSVAATSVNDLDIINGNTFADCKTDYVRDNYTTAGQEIYARCNSTVGTSLNFAKAAATANYYIKGAVERKSNTTLKAGTTLTILEGGSFTVVEGACLGVEKDAKIEGTIAGTKATAVTTAEELIATVTAIEDGTATTVLLADRIDASGLKVDAKALSLAWQMTNPEDARNITIDLNGKTLTLVKPTGVTDSQSLFVGTITDGTASQVGTAQKGKVNLTIQNGTIQANNSTGNTANLCVEAGNTLTLKGTNVKRSNVSGSGALLFVRGRDATLNVSDCDLTTSGVYAISTNASNGDQGVKINVTNSKITASAADKDDCAVLINTECTAVFENVEVSATRIGMLLKGGNVTVKGTSSITAAPEKLGWHDSSIANFYGNGSWGSGNEAPYGALVIGRSSGVAESAVNVTLEGTLTLSCKSPDGDQLDAKYASALYVDMSTGTVTVSGNNATVTVTEGQAYQVAKQSGSANSVTLTDVNLTEWGTTN